MNFEEQRTQMMFVEWLQYAGIKFFNHSPNEGKRSPQEGNKNRKMGTQRGFPDLEIPYPRGDKHGLYLEFKSSTGTATVEQKRWLAFLKKQGYEAAIVRTFDEARKITTEYMQNEK